MLLPLLLTLQAHASAGIGTASNSKDYLGNRNAPPNVIFLVDVHGQMVGNKCFVTNDPAGAYYCNDEVADALMSVLPKQNWARYGIAYLGNGTAPAFNSFTTPTDNYTGVFNQLESDGNGSAMSLYNAINDLHNLVGNGVTSSAQSVRNPAEAVSSIFTNVLRAPSMGDTWAKSPIIHTCEDTHIVLITTGRPHNDDSPINAGASTMASDVCCDVSGKLKQANTGSCTSGGGSPPSIDSECLLDNVAKYMYSSLDGSPIAGGQKVRLHVIYMDDASETGTNERQIARALYANVQAVQNNEVSYIQLQESGSINRFDLRRAIRDTLWVIRDRVTAEDAATEDVVQTKIDSQSQYAAIAWSSLVGDASVSAGGPRDSGHMQFWLLETDPTSASYGGFKTKLVDDVQTLESARQDSGGSPKNNDFPRSTGGNDKNRNVYTYMASADQMLSSANFTTFWKNAARQPIDDDLYTTIAAEASGNLGNWLEGFLGPTGGTDADELDADFDGDKDVDAIDLRNLIDYARDDDNADYRWVSQRSSFGEDRVPGFSGSIPAIVDYDQTTQFSTEASYQSFLTLLSAQGYGAVAFIGANDGSLRAYTITSPTAAWWPSYGSAGNELFRWIPEGVLAHDPAKLGNPFPSFPWHASYVDQIVYGRQLLGGGSVTVRDIWIDAQDTSADTGFGVKDCPNLPNCEWKRVAVLAREDAGAGILVLDITNPYSPKFLREYQGQTGDGMGTSRPVIATVYDDSNAAPAEHEDRSVLFFGTGRPPDIRDAPSTNGSGLLRQSVEPGIRTLALLETKPTNRVALTAMDNSFAAIPDWNGAASPTATTYDADTRMEFAGVQSPLAVLDSDADGDADVAYFTMTKTFRETADTAGLGPGTSPNWYNQQLPSTSLYKACRETAGAPGAWTYLKLADLGVAEVAFAPTISYFNDGTLGLFVVTSSPYDLDEFDYTAQQDIVQQRLYFGYDTDPDNCTGTPFSFTRKDTALATTPCGATAYVNFAAGERVVADPVVFGGYILVSTWTAATPLTAAACSLGSGQVRLYDYESCEHTTVGAFTGGDAAINGFPSNIAITDYGTVLAVGSTGSAISATALSLGAPQFDSVKVMNWMQVF